MILPRSSSTFCGSSRCFQGRAWEPPFFKKGFLILCMFGMLIVVMSFLVGPPCMAETKVFSVERFLDNVSFDAFNPRTTRSSAC